MWRDGGRPPPGRVAERRGDLPTPVIVYSPLCSLQTTAADDDRGRRDWTRRAAKDDVCATAAGVVPTASIFSVSSQEQQDEQTDVGRPRHERRNS